MIKAIHNKNTQTLLIEVYMYLNGLSPRIMLDLFTAKENIYNLRNSRELYCEKKKTWSPDYCPCRLSKTYPKNIGYIYIANTFSMT